MKKGLIGVQNWYSNLSELGKSYTICALGEDGEIPLKNGIMGSIKRRQYTITNCMRQDFYNEILKVLAPSNSIGKSKGYIDSELFVTRETN